MTEERVGLINIQTHTAAFDSRGGRVRPIYNAQGGALAKGDIVYFSGEDATSGYRKAIKADADSTTDVVRRAQGVVLEAIANTKTGWVALEAEVDGLDTSTASAVGDPVYLSTTAGGWTLSAPAQNQQIIGRVTVKAVAGKIRFDFTQNTQAAAGGMLDGTALLPGWPFIADIDLGFHRPGANQMAVVSAGAITAQIEGGTSGAPPASGTKSLLMLGPTAIAGGLSGGTYLGLNALTAFAGDFMNLQQNGTALFRFTSANTAVFGIQLTATAAGGSPSIAAYGANDINLTLKGKTAGGVVVDTGTGAPNASATRALLLLGATAPVGGNAAGTYLGANAATGYAGDFVALQQNGVSLVRVASVASAVNGFLFQLAALSSLPTLSPIGSDTDIPLMLKGKGTGGLRVDNGGTSGPTASATVALLRLGNNALVGGNAAGTYLGANTAGATNPGPTYAGDFITFQNNDKTVFSVTCAANAVNGVNVLAAATTASPVVAAIGNDTNVLLTLKGKGTRGVSIDNGAGTGPTGDATLAMLRLGVNLLASASASGTYLGINTGAANPGATYAGDFIACQNNGTTVFQVSSANAAVNGVQVQSAATGVASVIRAIGETNSALIVEPKGTSGLTLRTGGGVGSTVTIDAYDTDTGPAFVTFLTATAGTAPALTFNQGFTITEAKNVTLGTTTGSQIGTAASQKLGFFGAAPVVQQTKAGHNNWAAVADLAGALASLGLIDSA